jgi:steroid delta-isomerase-like uncharacterized protein
MSTETHKALCQRIVAEVMRGNLDAAGELLTTDYSDHADPLGTPPGAESAKQRWAMLRTAFPDGRITIEDMIAEGDKVAVRFTFRGTHTGDFMGMPPSGKQVAVTGIDINRIASGKLAERWANFDTLGMLQQLGVMPPPGQTAD